MTLFNNTFIEEKREKFGQVPVIILRPKNTNEKLQTIIFYHGWSSSKESQRFRGYIMAALGFRVILPDAVHHGERGSLDYDNGKIMGEYFWKVILQNVDESKVIIDELLKKYNISEDIISVAGHSMGGFTASGVFVSHTSLKSLCVINGSCAWNHINEIYGELFHITESPLSPEEQEKLNSLDPINQGEVLRDRPILLLHGKADSIVPIESQDVFYKSIFPIYNDKSKINFISYPRLDHYLTTNMIEEMMAFLGSGK